MSCNNNTQDIIDGSPTSGNQSNDFASNCHTVIKLLFLILGINVILFLMIMVKK